MHSSLVADAWFAWHSMPEEKKKEIFSKVKRKRNQRLTEVHDVITTDGTVVDDDIPCPQGNSVPLAEHSMQEERKKGKEKEKERKNCLCIAKIKSIE